jgi:hypothetical protein
MEWAGGNLKSFAQGAEAVKRFLGLTISSKALQLLTEKIGSERASLRNAKVADFEKGELPPRHREPPGMAAVMLDGGRAQTREAESAPGVHGQAWAETKVANLLTYTSISFREDPQPEPPRQYLDPPKVLQLVQEMKGAMGSVDRELKGTSRLRDPQSRSPRDRGPKPKVRTVVATTERAEKFGTMVAAEASERGFYRAKKKAALGDGSLWIWGLVAFHFVGFQPILDFLHLLVHLYQAAQAAHRGEGKKAWGLYVRLLRLAWAGEAGKLKHLLVREASKAGLPPKNASDDDPRKILANAVDYVERNRDKMDYARYRKEGLPISSAPVESLIKQVNQRVKGTEKFWVSEGLEAVLQVRAAYLSGDDRGEKFWLQRPASRAVGRNRLKPAA